jgi:hypothetical protein
MAAGLCGSGENPGHPAFSTTCAVNDPSLRIRVQWDAIVRTCDVSLHTPEGVVPAMQTCSYATVFTTHRIRRRRLSR